MIPRFIFPGVAKCWDLLVLVAPDALLTLIFILYQVIVKTVLLKYFTLIFDYYSDFRNISYFAKDEKKFREECRIDFDIIFTFI